jgi:hypothetical protein
MVEKMSIGKIIVIFLFAFPALFACGQEKDTMAGNGNPEKQFAFAEQQVEIVGTVQRTAKGIVIQSVYQTFIVIEKDLSDRVGRDVKVRGTLEDLNGRPAIRIKTVNVLN